MVGTGLAMVALPIGGPARADHVKMDEGQPTSPPRSPAPASTQTIYADQITAEQVRADSIYASRIDADEIQGRVHQFKDVRIGDTHGAIRAPEVTASVIHAEQISANTVVAQDVYVRDLRRR